MEITGPGGPRVGRRLHRAASMADVARLAGVSAQTVSRVVNDRANVDPATRERVLAAVDQLGYRANAAARTLATGSSRTIGVIASTLSTHGAVLVLDGITEEAARHGYRISLVPVHAPSLRDVSGVATALAGRDVDALVVCVASSVLREASAGLPVDVPVVVTDGDGQDVFPAVDSDPRPGVRAAVEHLLGLGHRRIAHLAGPDDSATARRRTTVWAQVLREHGLPVPAAPAGDWSAASGAALGAALLAEHPATTAVVCANDQMALGLLRACADAGVRVPHDLSVTGFDDVEAAAYAVPRLSTVRHDLVEVGRRAVRAVLQRLDPGADVGPVGLVPSEFVVRESTAAPRG
ncbi:LacI family DNA-binding transcriptional regulator [Kineococcus sp. SYSU DK006]|uniref:LacI family DNA-binding transcriptional regulator n=1 Tax=Kineococcus sp. SYSU DK006 TaxID=3383127 RepID=UPI003D7D3D9A